MKLLVETTGEFQLINAVNGTRIRFNRPTVVDSDSFVQSHIAYGHLKVFTHTLVDEATDADWEVWLAEAEGDIDLAVASYLTKFDAEAAKEPEVKTKAKGKG